MLVLTFIGGGVEGLGTVAGSRRPIAKVLLLASRRLEEKICEEI